MTRLVALCSSQGTACSETVLTAEEDTPTNRARIEAVYCGDSPDAPVRGTWTDVTDNEACAAFLDNELGVECSACGGFGCDSCDGAGL